MTHQLDGLTPGQRVAWHRVRRGKSQEVLAGLVGRTEDWLSKVENDRAPLDRISVIKALAHALDVSVFDLIGEGSPEVPGRQRYVDDVRAALMDYRQLSPLLFAIKADVEPPSVHLLQRDLAEVMRAYQDSRYSHVLRSLPELLTQTRVALRESSGRDRRPFERIAALTDQSAAMILTKLGESELAWIAAQRGLITAEHCGDPAVIGSLLRSVIHALHTDGAVQAMRGT
jgi:transcriptional regulator with XRE-family HTH domain